MQNIFFFNHSIKTEFLKGYILSLLSRQTFQGFAEVCYVYDSPNLSPIYKTEYCLTQNSSKLADQKWN